MYRLHFEAKDSWHCFHFDFPSRRIALHTFIVFYKSMVCGDILTLYDEDGKVFLKKFK